MKNDIEKIKKQIEFLYGEVSRQKQDLDDANNLILFLAKLIAKKEEDIEIL